MRRCEYGMWPEVFSSIFVDTTMMTDIFLQDEPSKHYLHTQTLSPR